MTQTLPEKDHPDPDWMTREVARGIGLLVSLFLPFGPKPEESAITARAWCWALVHGTSLSERDRLRVRRAFEVLGVTAKQWPTPADLIAALPRVETPSAIRLARDEFAPTVPQVLAARAAEDRHLVPLLEQFHLRGVPRET